MSEHLNHGQSDGGAYPSVPLEQTDGVTGDGLQHLQPTEPLQPPIPGFAYPWLPEKYPPDELSGGEYAEPPSKPLVFTPGLAALFDRIKEKHTGPILYDLSREYHPDPYALGSLRLVIEPPILTGMAETQTPVDQDPEGLQTDERSE